MSKASSKPPEEPATPAPAPKRARPKPLRFRQGEEIALNAVVITLDEYEEIVSDIDEAFDAADAWAGNTEEPADYRANIDRRRKRALRFLGLLRQVEEGRS